ncbi:MAG: undecaprenyl/decaprenyl-phosphate alpha-N-acetylglucosaminyl 1-phosphate transferase [Magnetococcales bacterium]|nr:undecaprenyl/decaprenyl-phosphate alpha-N-acetylglucosaminyl 1-phosphate transferase [Magnetococcales bacterium]
MVEWPLGTLFFAWLGTTLLLLIGQPFAHRVGWVDRPCARKIHTMPTPLIGGFAMFAGLMLALPQLELLHFPLDGIVVACGMGLLIGYLDDMHDIRASTRFVLEILLALWVILHSKVDIHTLGNLFGFGELTLGRFSVPFTTICFVGLVNAVNMSDGLDGQAGGQSLIALLLMLHLAIAGERWEEATLLLTFVAVVVAFLAFNGPWFGRKAALVFMGDAGSMLLGVALLWFSVTLTQWEPSVMAPITALWLVTVPLIDMYSSIARRLLTGARPFDPDMGHMHHLLLQRGCSKRQVCGIMMGLTAFFGVSGIAAWRAGVPDAVMFYLWMAVFVLYSWFSVLYHRRMRKASLVASEG